MHAIFLMYGHEDRVDFAKREMLTLKLPVRVWKEGQQDQIIIMQCQFRQLPFGVCEFIFPREFRDSVMAALRFNVKVYPQHMNFKWKFILNRIRKFLKADPVPKDFDTKNPVPLIIQDVSIIPIGIKDDVNITELKGDLVGWTHEGI